MSPAEYSELSPGEVVKSPLGHWTFRPAPLPPTLEFDVPLVNLLSKADRSLGELAGAGRRLPNPHLLIRPFLRREAVLSSRIEGTVTRLDQLFLFEAEPESLNHPSDAAEVKNYVVALEHGLEAVRLGQPLTLQFIRDVHRILMDGVRGGEKRPGEIRNRAVLIGKTNNFDEARFIPPCHTTLDPLLNDFIRFVREDESLPIIVQLALMHYQFETIHPFNDGNGRVGRLLVTTLLCARGILPQPLLYLSGYFERNRQAFYDHLLAVSQRGEWREWIAFFARGVTEQASDAINRTRQLLNLWETYRRQAAQTVRSANGQRLVDELFSSPYLSINRAREVMGVAFKSASNIVAKFAEAGMLREITNQARYRVYCADQIFALLDSPIADPPPGTP